MIAPNNTRLPARLPADLVAELDRVVAAAGSTRSKEIFGAIRAELDRRAKAGPPGERVRVQATMDRATAGELRSALLPGESVSGAVEAAIRNIF